MAAGDAPTARRVPAPRADAPCPVHAPAVPREQVDPALRARATAIRRVFWITLVLNLAAAVAKGAYSWLSGSITLGADAFHSLLDGSANVLALVGMHFAAAPADDDHPYGHGKFETLAALGIGVLISVSLFEVAGAAFDALLGKRPPPEVGWPGFAVVLASMAVNLAVSRYEFAKGRALGSPLLSADARHTESDLYASGAVLLSFLGARAGAAWVDGACGLVLVAMVGRIAWHVFRDTAPTLVDAAVLDPTRVQEIGLGIDGVASIHGVRSRGSRWAAVLDLHMEVAGGMKVEDAHRIAHRVEEELRARLPNVADVVVHIEPDTHAAAHGASPDARVGSPDKP